MYVATFFSFQGQLPLLELELLKSFRRSLLQIYPNCIFKVLTDPSSVSLINENGFTAFAIEVEPRTLLLDRLRGFRKFIAELPENSDCFMFDYDMLILKDLKITEYRVDIAYTVREHLTEQPINGGIVYYKNNLRSLKILNEIIDSYGSLPMEKQNWWGDQLALRKVFERKFGIVKQGVYATDDTRVLFLDAKKYNFTPFDMDISLPTQGANLFIQDHLGKWLNVDLDTLYVCHFKGPRKHLQLQFEWQRKNKGVYAEYITRQFYQHIDNIRGGGASYLEGLAQLHPSINEVNDFAVLYYLNAETISDCETAIDKKIFINHLKKYRDARYNVLLSELPELMGMR